VKCLKEVFITPPPYISLKNVKGTSMFSQHYRNVVHLNRKTQIVDGGLQTGKTNLSNCRHDRSTISKAVAIFLGPDNHSQSRALHKLTGSANFEMIDSKPEVPITILPCKHDGNKIPTQYPMYLERNTHVFCIRQHGKTGENTVRCLAIAIWL